MRIEYHKHFKRQYRKLPTRVCVHCDHRLRLFATDPFHPLLNNHALTGALKQFRSINISGDLRALYRVENETVIFATIDTHGNLYG